MTAGYFPAIRTTAPVRQALSKVPEVTVYFWIVKVATTFMGEATSDYLVHSMSPYLAVGLGFLAFAVSLAAQFAVSRYIPWIYWTAVAMVAVFGTMAADVLHVALKVPYAISTTAFAITLAVVFALWYRVERTLSIHSIRTRRREVFYWAAVITAFALGTAAGDMTAKTLGLGYLGSGLMFAVLFALPGIAFRWLGLGAISSFWIAYVLTRPLGASFADWMGFGHSVGGLGIGHGPVSVVSTLFIAVFVIYLSVSGRDKPRELASVGPPTGDRWPRPMPLRGARRGRHRAGAR